MKVLGKNRLQGFERSSCSVGGWVRAWIAEIESAEWKQSADVSADYPSVKFRGVNNATFLIGSSNMNVDVGLSFASGVALILNVSGKK